MNKPNQKDEMSEQLTCLQ